MNKTELILDYIRENVEGLKRKMDFIQNHETYSAETKEYLVGITEVQLNHLLLAIPKSAMVNNGDRLVLVSLQENGGRFDYNLTQSVEENLNNNEELCDYIVNLFNLK